ncbi:MAG: CHAT domain-containing protein [Bacteroidota bacterium]
MNRILNYMLLLLFWSFSLLPQGLLAQYTPSTDSVSTDALQWFHQADSLFTIDMDRAAQSMKRALPLFETASNWEWSVRTLNALSTIHYYRNDYELYKTYAQRAFEEARIHLGKKHPYYGESLNNLGGYYYLIGNFDKTIELLKQDASVKELNNASKVEQAFTFHNLGKNYRRRGDYTQAIKYLRKSLEYRLDIPDMDDYLIAYTYHDLARIYKDQGQNDTSLYYFNFCLDILNMLPAADKRVVKRKISTHQGMSDIWVKKGKPDRAKQEIYKAIALQQKSAWRNWINHHLLAKIALKDQRPHQALEHLQLALKLNAQGISKAANPTNARILLTTGETYALLKDYTAALENYHAALLQLSPAQVRNKPVSFDPTADQLLDKSIALKILKGKAEAWQQLYRQEGHLSHLKASYKSYLVMADLIKAIRQGFQTVEAKNTLASESVGIYEGALLVASELYQQTNDPTYLKTAFYLAESNKALLLLEALNEQAARGFAGIPDSLLEREKDLRINLAFYQKMLLEKQLEESPAEEVIRNLQSSIFDLNEQLELLIGQFELHYPRYHTLKSNTRVPPLEELQEKLAQKNATLLEYFLGDSLLFVFKVDARSIDLYKLSNESLAHKIDVFRTTLTAPAKRQLVAEDFHTYTTSANELYQLLFPFALPEMDGDLRHLIIIPDHQLNYVPFELLLSQNVPTTAAADFHTSNLSYLIEQFAVSYDYSATLFCKNQERKYPRDYASFIGFAPDFELYAEQENRGCTEDQLFQLHCNRREVSNISTLMGGKALLGEMANTTNFELEAVNHLIIHLATHACANEHTPMLNKIYLSDNHLSGIDLNNLRLNAELAVLSACNTGSGKLIKGEGVMSLARSFMTAGCNSTLMSMWAVNDCATSDIMLYFYQELKAGRSKDEALRQAKLKYLSQASKALAHPYYWGPFLQFGDARPIRLKSEAPPALWALSILVVAIGGWWMFRFRMRKTKAYQRSS